MLKELHIQDFALIENLDVVFTSGLNILTGETGAGKSIIIDALNACLGGRVSAQQIRASAEKSSIEATFATGSRLMNWLKQNELADSEQDEFVVAREITKTGSKARINGTLVNVQQVSELKTLLLAVHAQHEARTLLSPSAQLEIIDVLGDAAHKKLLDKVRLGYVQAQELKKQLEETAISEQERVRQLEFARFQLAELLDAALDGVSEDDELNDECQVLSNVVVLEEAAAKAHEALAGPDGGEGAFDLINQALFAVEKASHTDKNLLSAVESLQAALTHAEDAKAELRRYREALDSDPAELDLLQARLAALSAIKRKYGPALADAIGRRDSLTRQIEDLEQLESKKEGLQGELDAIWAQLEKDASKLSQLRKEIAKKFAEGVQASLSELGMPHCQFEISFMGEGSGDEKTKLGPNGLDRVEFLIAPNPGQAKAGLAKIASGGELSRVMLSIKSILSQKDQVASVIFDEIDTGLSGKALQAMRDKLALLARSHQILCITHQPLIAAAADNHIQVSKNQTAKATTVFVANLDKKARLEALATMASGQGDQKAAFSFAQSLINEASGLRDGNK